MDQLLRSADLEPPPQSFKRVHRTETQMTRQMSLSELASISNHPHKLLIHDTSLLLNKEQYAADWILIKLVSVQYIQEQQPQWPRCASRIQAGVQNSSQHEV